jgi:hypothetical protein
MAGLLFRNRDRSKRRSSTYAQVSVSTLSRVSHILQNTTRSTVRVRNRLQTVPSYSVIVKLPLGSAPNTRSIASSLACRLRPALPAPAGFAFLVTRIAHWPAYVQVSIRTSSPACISHETRRIPHKECETAYRPFSNIQLSFTCLGVIARSCVNLPLTT